MFQTTDPITLNYLDILLEFNKESTPKHGPKVPFWKSTIYQALHTKSITMEQIQLKHTNSRLILQVLFDWWGALSQWYINKSCTVDNWENGGSILPAKHNETHNDSA